MFPLLKKSGHNNFHLYCYWTYIYYKKASQHFFSHFLNDLQHRIKLPFWTQSMDAAILRNSVWRNPHHVILPKKIDGHLLVFENEQTPYKSYRLLLELSFCPTRNSLHKNDLVLDDSDLDTLAGASVGTSSSIEFLLSRTCRTIPTNSSSTLWFRTTEISTYLQW